MHGNNEDTTRYLIWSHRQGRWWRPGRYGYTASMSAAGRASREAALSLCLNVMPDAADRINALPSLPVRLEDVEGLMAAYEARHPRQFGRWR